MILHTVKHSPFSHKSLQHALARLSSDDYLLVIENGVIAAAVSHDDSAALVSLAAQQRLFVLKSDLIARGLVSNVGQVVDYKGFVSLVVKADSSIAW